MERQQEIEERSDLIIKADEKERQELKRFDLPYGIFLILLFLVSWIFFVQYEDFRDMQPATQNNCKVLFMMRLARVRLFGWLFKLIL
ncbi:hypothetical protein ACKU2X_028585 [Klebsiella pneumoniae]